MTTQNCIASVKSVIAKTNHIMGTTPLHSFCIS